jgi:hypothetical protein
LLYTSEQGLSFRSALGNRAFAISSSESVSGPQ